MKGKNLTAGLAYGLALGVALGLVVGTVAGVILAPTSGAEIRRRLRFEREQALGVAQKRVRRTIKRLNLAPPVSEEGEKDEEEFQGA
jgi:gas vesicle protein